MNILIINGSPRGKNSNTWQITQAFVEGLSSACNAVPPQIEFADLNRMDVRPCRGCFSCWRVTPGTCVIKDDMAWILEKTLWADIVIWSFPLYYFYVPGPVKTMIDRRLPLTLRISSPTRSARGLPSTRRVMIFPGNVTCWFPPAAFINRTESMAMSSACSIGCTARGNMKPSFAAKASCSAFLR